MFSLVVTLVYVFLLLFRILYGIAYYIIPSILFLTGFILNCEFNKSMENPILNYSSMIFNYLAFLVYFVSYILTGMIFGMGLNVYILSPFTYVLRIILVVSTTLFIESFRALIVNKHVGKINPLIYTIASSFLFALVYTMILEGLPSNFNWITKYIAILSLNILLSITAWQYVFKSQLFIMLSYIVFFYLAPLLPLANSLLSFIFPVVLQILLVSFILHSLTKPMSVTVVKKHSSLLSKIAYIFIFVLAIGVLVSFLLGIRFLVIISGSMAPSINIGDIIVSIPTPRENILIDDIIVFKSDMGIIAHRVIGFKGDECFITKGDANRDPDPLWACSESIIGEVVFVIPGIGYPIVYLLELFGNYSNVISFTLSILSLIYIFYMVKEVELY